MAVEVDEPVVGLSEEKHEGKQHKIKSTVLDSFTLLGNNSEPTRINGAVKLLSYLFTNVDNEEAEKESTYALNRLIRGIASNRPSAREGYFTALTVYLTNQDNVSITTLLQILNKELLIGGQSKSETGEICTGHVLACGAVLRSGLMQSSTPEERVALLTTLLTAANRKAYLGLAAYSFLADFINNNDEAVVKECLWPHLQQDLGRPLEEQSLDSLLCLFTLAGKCPSLLKKLCRKNLNIPALFCPDTMPTLCEKIMNAPEFASVNHPIYEVFGKEIAKSEHLVLFWTTGLQSRLTFRNQNRAIIACKILNAVFKNIGDNVKHVPEILGDRFIPCIMEWFKGFKSACMTGKVKQFRGKPRYADEGNEGRQVVLNAKAAFDSLVEALKHETVETETKIETLKKLLFQPGDIMFCEITNTKLIKALIEDLKFDGIKELASLLKKVVSNESKKVQVNMSERSWTNTERLRAAEMFTQLVTHRVAMDNVKWRLKSMQFLLHISLFKSTGHEDSASVSTELAAAVKKCFFRCLNFKLPKLESLLKVLSSLVDYIDENLSNKDKLTKLTKPFPPETIESWKSMREFTNKLVKSGTTDASKANTVFQILSLHSGLFLFSDMMSDEMARNSLKEVQSCYEHYTKDRKEGKKKKLDALAEGDIVEEEPEWIEVLVDVFLNFLSRDSQLLRNVVQCVFRLLCEYLTPSAVGQIISVLDPDNDANPLSYHDESSDEEDNGKEAMDEEDNENDDEENEDDMDNDSSDEEDEVDNTTITDQLRMAVQKALGSAAPETDTESIDADEIGEEEGKRLDEALSSAFKMLRQSKGKKSKRDKKNDKLLMDFRIRVLDLVDIYLEKEPSMELCLGMLSPLSRCLEFSIKDDSQKQLEMKVRKSLKYLTSVKSFSSADRVTSELLAENLKAVTSRGERTQFVFQALGDVISKCSTFIVRCSQKIQPAETPGKKKKKHRPSPVTEIFKENLVTFFTKRDCLLPVILFHDVLQQNWEGCWDLVLLLVQKSFDEDVRQFRKNEGLEMVNMYYKNLKRHLRSDTAERFSLKLKPIEETLSDNILACNAEVNERFFSILTKLLVSINTYHKSVVGSQSSMKWEEIKPAVQKCRKCIKLKNTQDYYKFCNTFALTKITNQEVVVSKVEEKDSADSGHDSNMDGEDELTSKKGKKAKNKLTNGNVQNGNEKHDNKIKQRKPKEISKKEAKQLRIQASSEGLQNVSFTQLLYSNIDVDDIGEQDLEEEEEKKPKKRKNNVEASNEKKKKKHKNHS